MMIETYKQSPNFGDAKQFQGEYETAVHKVQVLEEELKALKAELDDVHGRLEDIRSKSPSMSRKNSSQSLVSNSNSSNSTTSRTKPQTKPMRSDDWEDDFDDENEKYVTESDRSISISVPPPVQGSAAPPPPPPPPSFNTQVAEEPDLKKVVALYSFDSDSSDTITITEGEEFYVVEEDQDGWTKVKRVDGSNNNGLTEGFIPTSYIQDI